MGTTNCGAVPFGSSGAGSTQQKTTTIVYQLVMLVSDRYGYEGRTKNYLPEYDTVKLKQTNVPVF